MGAQLLEQIITDLGLEDISFKIWRYLSEMSGKTLCLKQYCFLKIVKDKNVMFILSPTKGRQKKTAVGCDVKLSQVGYSINYYKWLTS